MSVSARADSPAFTANDSVARKVPTAAVKSNRRIAADLFASGAKRQAKRKTEYAIGAVEAILYDNRHHKDDHLLLCKDDIIPIEHDPSQGPIDKRLIRCFRHDFAKIMAIVMLMSVSVTTVVAPLTFIWGGHWSNVELVPGGYFTLTVDVLMDVCFFIAMCLRLNTSFMDQEMRVEIVDRGKIMRRSLYNPFYLLMMWSATAQIWIAVGAPMVLNMVKFARFFMLCHLPDPLIWWRDTRRWRVVRAILLMLGGSHWIACIFAWGTGYREMLLEDGAQNWTTHWDGQTVDGWTSFYFMALVESVYVLTGALDNPIGDGGPRERNFGSLVFVTIMGPVGAIIIAVFISAVVREQSLKYALEMRHEENKAFMRRAMATLRIPHELQRRVFSLHYFQRMSHDKEALKELLRSENLSVPLESALRLYIYRRVLESGLLITENNTYILEVVRVLEDSIYIPGDFVCRRGELGAEAFFIQQGELLVLVPGVPGSNLIEDAIGLHPKRRAGDYLGEIMLIKSCPRTAWVRAETYTVCAVLRRDAIEGIWQFWPEEREKVVRIVNETINKDRWRNAGKVALTAIKERRQAENAQESEPEALETIAEAAERGGAGARVSVASASRRLTVEEARAAQDEEAAASLIAPDRPDIRKPQPQQIKALCVRILRGQEQLQEQVDELCRRQGSLEDLVKSQAQGGAPAAQGAASGSRRAPQPALFSEDSGPLETPPRDAAPASSKSKRRVRAPGRHAGREPESTTSPGARS